ncbi:MULTISPECIES: hypothetical protein [Streptomyces]|nr:MULTISPECIES: hypothetical protein [Streptomyces]MCH0558788.1 hypothetical protein [Streptomyces sp. MUM 16J]
MVDGVPGHGMNLPPGAPPPLPFPVESSLQELEEALGIEALELQQTCRG